MRAVRLVNIDRDKLLAEARGDPWQVNATLQHGRPAQIDGLAQAFNKAGQSTTEAGIAFAQARERFENSWNRENGEHPINDSAEVQLATTSLGVQATQLPEIRRSGEHRRGSGRGAASLRHVHLES